MAVLPRLPNAVSSLLLALTLALLVWIAATNTELKQVIFPSSLPERGIPVELVNVPEGLVVTEGQGHRVLVTLLIPRDREADLSADDVIARADLSGRGPGVHQISVEILRQPGAPRFRELRLSPAWIRVQLDEVVQRAFPVEAVIADSATIPPTYQVLTPTIEPPTITIEGPRSIVEPIERVVAEVSVSNAQGPVSEEVPIQFFGLEGRIEAPSIRASTNRVTVDVPIEQRQGYRDMIVRAVTVGTPARGYWVSSFNVEPTVVTVVGQPSIVSSLDGIIDTEPISVEGLSDGEFIRNVPLQLPDEVSPLEENSVRVHIKIEPQTSSKQVTLEPTIVGLQPGLIVAENGIVPSTVEVLLKGPVIELDELDPGEISVELDLSGRPPGTYLVEPLVTASRSLRAESVNPEQVEVTIVEQHATREVALEVEAVGLPPRTYGIVAPQTVSFTLQGPLLRLEEIDAEETRATVDVTNLPRGSHVLTPTLAVQEGISITNRLPSTVTVQILGEEEVLAVTAPIQAVNVGTGLQATLGSDIVIVRATGPGSAAALRRHPSFRVVLDLAGLVEGNHRVRPRVTLPPGYSLVAIVPDRVEVRLRR